MDFMTSITNPNPDPNPNPNPNPKPNPSPNPNPKPELPGVGGPDGLPADPKRKHLSRVADWFFGVLMKRAPWQNWTNDIYDAMRCIDFLPIA